MLAEAQEALDHHSALHAAKRRVLEPQVSGCWQLAGFSARPTFRLDGRNVTYSRWLLDRFGLAELDARTEGGSPTRLHPDCKNSLCVNPAHYLVAPPQGGKQGRRRLDSGDLRSIRVARRHGRTTKELAAHYGVTMATIRRIVGGHGCYDE